MQPTIVGIREFIVGTGGESLDTLTTTASSADVQASTDMYRGTMTLRLNHNSFLWFAGPWHWPEPVSL